MLPAALSGSRMGDVLYMLHTLIGNMLGAGLDPARFGLQRAAIPHSPQQQIESAFEAMAQALRQAETRLSQDPEIVRRLVVRPVRGAPPPYMQHAPQPYAGVPQQPISRPADVPIGRPADPYAGLAFEPLGEAAPPIPPPPPPEAPPRAMGPMMPMMTFDEPALAMAVSPQVDPLPIVPSATLTPAAPSGKEVSAAPQGAPSSPLEASSPAASKPVATPPSPPPVTADEIASIVLPLEEGDSPSQPNGVSKSS